MLISALQKSDCYTYIYIYSFSCSSPRILNIVYFPVLYSRGFPGGSLVENLPANAGDTGDVGSIPRLRRSPREGNGKALQYSCVENSKDRGAWWTVVHRVAKSRTRLIYS